MSSLTGTIYRIVGTGDTGESQVTTLTGQCLHAQGTQLLVWPCTGGSGQRWVLQGDGALLNPASGRCADSAASVSLRGAGQLRLSDCNSQSSQQFTPTPDNELRGASGQCLDHSRTARRSVEMSDCSGANSQVWVFVPAPAPARAKR
ncbi:RICIN domain-containing protein [Luteimonas terricola]|uniref:RICIN domain-containing protein n=1 Tax=Luteimonas terricola TaxID=645597 RepID=UPI003132D6C7